MKTSALHVIPLTTLKGIGPKMAEKLERLGLRTIQDMLFHLPARYQDRTQLSAIARLRPGDYATLVADSIDARVHMGRRRSLLVKVTDRSGVLTLRFFRFTAAQQQQMAAGQRLQIYGEVRPGPMGPEMIHPEFKVLEAGAEPELPNTLTPIYPATEGVHQLTLSKLAEQVMTYLNAESLPELLPESDRKSTRLN